MTGADVGGSQQMAWPESIRAEVEWAIGGKHDRRDVLDAEDVPFESVDALNTCLAAMDIPAWILAGLSIVCGVACVASFTPPGLVACALCSAAASGFAVGVVTTCVNYANNA